MSKSKAVRVFKHADLRELARFIEKVDFTDDCWLWTAHCNKGGYATLAVKRDGKWLPRMGHQLSYEWSRGKPAPKRHSGWNLDHKCDTRHCVNPWHIRKVTFLKNTTVYATNGQSNKTHCPQGHPYDETNTYITPEGFRHCRECVRRRNREWKLRNNYK